MHLNNTAWEKEHYPEWDLRCFLQSWWIRWLPAYKCRMYEYPNKGCIRIAGPRVNRRGQIEEGLTAVSRVEGWRGHCFGRLRNKRQKIGQWGRVIKMEKQSVMGKDVIQVLKNVSFRKLYFTMLSCNVIVAPWVFLQPQETNNLVRVNC